MGYALYAQYVLHLEPCPLCIFQRVAVIALGTVFLLGALFGAKSNGGKRAWSVLALLMALAGIVVAGRHLWLQTLPPDQVPACGPGLSYMIDAMPSARCWPRSSRVPANARRFRGVSLGLAMPGWVLISLVVLAAWALYVGFRRANKLHGVTIICHLARAKLWHDACCDATNSRHARRPDAKSDINEHQRTSQRMDAAAGARGDAATAISRRRRARIHARRIAPSPAAAGDVVGNPSLSSSSPKHRKENASCCRAAIAPRAQ